MCINNIFIKVLINIKEIIIYILLYCGGRGGVGEREEENTNDWEGNGDQTCEFPSQS